MEVRIGGQRKFFRSMMEPLPHHFLWVSGMGGFLFIVVSRKIKSHKWYKLFRTENRFSRGEAHLVTVTFDENEKAIYIDGQLRNKKDVELNGRTHLKFSGNFFAREFT